MEIKEKQIEVGDMVRLDDTKGRSFVGFAYEPALLHKVFKVPFTEGAVIGVSYVDLKKLDISLNPLKILDTLNNIAFKVEGFPTVFKESEIEEIYQLDVLDDGLTEAERQAQADEEELNELEGEESVD